MDGARATDHPLRHLIGRSVPGGEFSIGASENWLAHDALYSPPASVPHPVMAFVAAQRGMGCTVAELFRLLDSDIEDGPLLAGTTIELERDLAVDETYFVAGTITDLARKHGSALGTFDLATCRFTIADHSGNQVAAVTNVYAISRNR